MENSYLDNKIILKYCKDYYRLINEEFSELDYISDKIIQVFQSFIFSVNIKSKQEMKKVAVINDAVARYFDDVEFKKILTNYLIGLKVSKKEENVISFIADRIISEYEKYKEGYTRNLYTAKWV